MLAALSRILVAHEHGGGALASVDAVGEKAQRLYAHYGFVPISNTGEDTVRMAVPMATIAALLRTP